jgi:hypothetical protein
MISNRKVTFEITNKSVGIKRTVRIEDFFVNLGSYIITHHNVKSVFDFVPFQNFTEFDPVPTVISLKFQGIDGNSF